MNVRRSITAVVAVPVLALGTASCGFDAPTDQIYNPAVGVSDQSGEVDVLNVVIVSAEDGSGTLVASFANNDTENDDALSGVTGEGAEVQVEGDTEIPAAGFLNLSDGSLQVTGEGVTPGATVGLTFGFDRAEPITLQAPVVEQSSEGPYADVPVS